MSIDIGRILERFMAMDDATWARHANPWSGWSRVVILPLFCLAVWSRVWLGWWTLLPVVLVLVWTWVNPRIFPAPAATDNWMTQGVLGERIWLARQRHPIPAQHNRVTRLLNIAAGLGALAMVWGLIQFDALLTLGGIIMSMGAKLWFLDRMVWLKADMDSARGDD